ncbi:hypothetical protein ASZ90_008875 [hydrocarbon metagenome]|uniref:Uncharacterized protein n=1 Tax=hydrocarbon metagenome TaxID=938273 RepID=A0A0W8FKD1_9ZZZZ
MPAAQGIRTAVKTAARAAEGAGRIFQGCWGMPPLPVSTGVSALPIMSPGPGGITGTIRMPVSAAAGSGRM